MFLVIPNPPPRCGEIQVKPVVISGQGWFKGEGMMLNSRTIALIIASVLALGVIGGCSNDYDTDANGSEKGATSDSAPAVATERAPSQVFLDLEKVGARVVAVGESGAIRVSDDNGDSWQKVDSGVSSTLTAVTFVSEQTGWVVGHDGTLLRTDDGGEHWKSLGPAHQIEADQALLDVAFDEQGGGIIVGADRFVFTTRDGGEHWAPEQLTVSIYDPVLNGAAILEGGQQLIVANQGIILSREGWRTDWVVSFKRGRQLRGVIGLGEGEALAYGLEGTVLQSLDGGNNWEGVESISTAGYFSGQLISDGSVVLVGSEGIVARRLAGGERVYPEMDLPLGALTGVVEGDSGRLLLTGIQGVGYQQDKRYWFHGIENGVTGLMAAKALHRRIELPPLFEVMLEQNGYGAGYGFKPASEWAEINLAAINPSDDVLEPHVFNAIEGFYQALKTDPDWPMTEPWSIWNRFRYNYLLLQGPYGYLQNYPIVLDKSAYSESERPYLERRIKQAALSDKIISSDYRSLLVFASVPPRVVGEGDEAERERIHTVLSELAKKSVNKERNFRVSDIKMARLEEVQPDGQLGSAQGTAEPLEAENIESVESEVEFLYVVRRTKNSAYGCPRRDIVARADRLSIFLKTQRAPESVLSVADFAKVNQVSAKKENWKWFTTSGDGSFSNDAYEIWNQGGCPNPLAVIFGKANADNRSEALEELVGEFEEIDDQNDTAESLEVKTFRVKRTLL